MRYRDQRDVIFYNIFKNLEIVGKYDSPVIQPIQKIPKNLIPFNKAKSCKNPQDYFVHFYVDDYQFERIWKSPKEYATMLSKFAGIIGPDFSAYTDLSMSQRIYNIYRNKALTAYWQHMGLNVIPNARWIDNAQIDFNNGLDGLPIHSTLAITTNGTQKAHMKVIFERELADILEQLKPTNLVVYGTLSEHERQLCKDNNTNVIEFKSFIDTIGRIQNER